MIRFLIVILFVLVNIKQVLGYQTLPFSILFYGENGSLGSGENHQKTRTVIISDTNALRREFRNIWPNKSTQIPNVDFEAGVVVLLDLGKKQSLGYHVAIDSIVQIGQEIVIRYITSSNGEGCVVLWSESRPFLFAYVNASAGRIVFQEIKQRGEACK